MNKGRLLTLVVTVALVFGLAVACGGDEPEPAPALRRYQHLLRRYQHLLRRYQHLLRRYQHLLRRHQRLLPLAWEPPEDRWSQ
jgi:transposase